MPWYGNTASRARVPRPTVYAPPRGSTIGSHSTVAPAPDAAITAPPLVRVDDRVVERAALQHRAQVQRRAVGEVDELGDRASRRRWRRPRRRAGSATIETGDLRAELVEPLGRPLDDPLGMLERGRGREHDHLVAPGTLASRPAVERAARARSTRRRRRSASVPVGFYAVATGCGSYGDVRPLRRRWPRPATHR